MLQVTVDLVPHGLKNKKRTLYIIEIANVGVGIVIDGNKPTYNYEIRTVDNVGNKTNHGMLVKNFDRGKHAHKLVNEVVNKLDEKGVF